jgi:plasmid replication initiation protein
MKNAMIVKSNMLVEASYKLTAQEQRVILTLTSKIRPEDEDFKEYCISVKEFATLTGVSLKWKYDDVKEITRKLIGRVFTIHEATGPLQLSWVSSAKYHEGEGTVTLRFDPGLKPYLLQLKDCFTKYSLALALRLKSSFSIRIYELLKQYEKVGTRAFQLEELKEKLGISEDQYKLYGHFKAKVLKVAQEELLEKTDLSFDYEEIKVGRGVGKIRFIIRSQMAPQVIEQQELPNMSDVAVSKEEELLNELMSLIPKTFQEKQSIKNIIQKAFKAYNFDYVMRNILYSNEKSNAARPGANIGKGSNYRVYLSKALQADYGLAYQEDQESKNELLRKQREATASDAKLKNQELAIILEEMENREKARTFIKSYAPETLQAFEQQAQLRMSADGLSRYKRKDPIGNIEFKRRLEDVVMEHTGLRHPQPETVSGLSENDHADREVSVDAA